MTERVYRDFKGVPFKVIEYAGHKIQPIPGIVEHIEALPHLLSREDDITLVAYPRSGAHWVWEICMRLLTNSSDSSFNMGIGKYYLEFSSSGVLSDQPSPRVLVSHLPFQLLSRAVGLMHNRIIHVVRNPKDVAVSRYNQSLAMNRSYSYDGDWAGYFELSLQGQVDRGSWFDHVLQWESFRDSQPVAKALLLYYEDLKEDLLREVKKIATFLQISHSEEFYQSVADQCTFSVMKENRDARASQRLLDMYKDGKSKMYRKGEIGDWKNYFTVDQSQRFDAVYAERMALSHMTFRFM